MFAERAPFPPPREIDHAIIIQPGEGPVRVRPYQYTYHQKDEMKRLVQETLVVGVTRPSSSLLARSFLCERRTAVGDFM